MDSNDSSFPHLKCKLAFTPGVTRLKLSRSRLVIQGQGSPEWDSSAFDVDVHGEVEELGISVLHLVLAEEQPDELFGGCLVCHAQRLILDV